MSSISAGITSGTALVSTGDTTGNLVFQTNGTTTAMTINTAQDVSMSAKLQVTGNVTGGNLITAGLASVTGNVTGGNLITVGLASVTGNITGGNLITTGLVSATGNISGANLSLTGNMTMSGTGSLTLPVGNTAQRPASPAAGMIRYNSTTSQPEWYESTGNAWQDFDTKSAFASFYYSVNDAAGSLTIASTDTYGTTMAFNKLGPSQNITANTTNSTWTHTYTGTYSIFTAYRQASGGDVWTVLAVTKNGNANAVGISARTGSEDSHNENYTVVYTVDDTTATYQLQQWVQATGKTVLSDFTGNPGWNNYATLCGNTTGDIGRMVDYYVVRLGD